MNHKPKRLLFKSLMFLLILTLLIFILLLISIFLSRIDIPKDLPKVSMNESIVIDNVHIMTMNSENVLQDKQLLIKNGLVAEIKPAGSVVDKRYRVINGNGNYILPGLIDMHVHVMEQKYLALSLSYGVTSVRNMGGYPVHLRWKKELAEGKWLGSNLYSSSPILNGEKYSDPFMHRVVTSPGLARALVTEYKEEGWDFIKVYENLNADVYEAIIDEAGKLNFPVAGHAPYSIVDKGYASIAQLVSFEHAEEIYDGLLNYTFDHEKLKQVVYALKEHNVTVTPTLMVFDHLTKISTKKQNYINSLSIEYLNPFFKFITDTTGGNRWLNSTHKMGEYNTQLNLFQKQIVKLLSDQEVNLLVGSDSGSLYTIAGQATHKEMMLLHNAGVPPFEVIKAATKNAAKVLNIGDKVGSIRKGMVADLIMVRANPIENLDVLREPRAVIKGGQYLDENNLRELKKSAKNQSGFLVSLGRALDFFISK